MCAGSAEEGVEKAWTGQDRPAKGYTCSQGRGARCVLHTPSCPGNRLRRARLVTTPPCQTSQRAGTSLTAPTPKRRRQTALCSSDHLIHAWEICPSPLPMLSGTSIHEAVLNSGPALSPSTPPAHPKEAEVLLLQRGSSSQDVDAQPLTRSGCPAPRPFSAACP